MIKSRKLLIFSFSLCFVAGAYLIGSFGLPLGDLKSPGAGFYPLLIGVVFLVIGTALCIRSFFSKKEDGGEAFPAGKDLKRVISIASVLFIFAIVFRPLGYGISSGILVLAVLRVLGMQGWLKIVGISLATATLSYLFFSSILGVPLPSGTIFS
jgi:hypothetical protein